MHNSLSITNAKGRQVNLLNDDSKTKINEQRKRYHCSEPGCQKSFTTSGHLARHHRIHTGEKNFHCIYPGCPSRFSRQDNMMQHYRTHLSSRSRHHHYTNHHHQQQRQQEQQILHCHSYFRSEKAELYSLTSLSPTTKSRGWSMSSSSSSDTMSYYPPHISTTTPISLPPDYSTKPYQLQPQKLPVQNWNHPDHKYSPALYHDYHLI